MVLNENVVHMVAAYPRYHFRKKGKQSFVIYGRIELWKLAFIQKSAYMKEHDFVILELWLIAIWRDNSCTLYSNSNLHASVGDVQFVHRQNVAVW